MKGITKVQKIISDLIHLEYSKIKGENAKNVARKNAEDLPKNVNENIKINAKKIIPKMYMGK